jgi:hypothetical protein
MKPDLNVPLVRYRTYVTRKITVLDEEHLNLVPVTWNDIAVRVGEESLVELVSGIFAHPRELVTQKNPQLDQAFPGRGRVLCIQKHSTTR